MKNIQVEILKQLCSINKQLSSILSLLQEDKNYRLQEMNRFLQFQDKIRLSAASLSVRRRHLKENENCGKEAL